MFLPGDFKKDWSHICGMCEIVFEKVKAAGLRDGEVYSSFLIVCDGSSSENRNRFVMNYLQEKRVINNFEEICMQPACCHHCNNEPDRRHSEVASRLSKHALLEKLNIKSHTELVTLGNNIIKPIVDGLGKLTEKTITSYDGLKNTYKPSRYVEDCRMKWIQNTAILDTIPNSTSSFPHFIPRKSREIMKTHYYMFRFYECRITKQFPNQFNFLILPGQLEFYQNKIVNQS